MLVKTCDLDAGKITSLLKPAKVMISITKAPYLHQYPP